MSNNCGQMPVYIPTYVNLKVRNLDVVDVAAASVSCTKLTVQGNPVSDVFQNVIATPGVTQFVGDVVTNNLTANRSIETATIVSEDITTQTLDVTGTLNAASTSVTTLYAANISTGGSIQMINTNASATLKNLSCPSAVFADCQSSNLTVLSTLTTGTLTQSSGVTTLRQTTVDSLTTGGNITQNSGTANLKAVTATSVNCTGSFSAGTFSPSNISNSGTLTQTGAATFATDITQTAGKAILQDVVCDTITGSGNCIYSIARYKLGTAKTTTTTSWETVTGMAGTNYGLASSRLSYNSTTGVFTNISGKTCIFKLSYSFQFSNSTKGWTRFSRIRVTSDTDVYGVMYFRNHYSQLDPSNPSMETTLATTDIFSVASNGTFTLQFGGQDETGVVLSTDSYAVIECLG